MGSTDFGDLPFPDGLGSSNNPPADIKALAEAVAARLPRVGRITKTPPPQAATPYNIVFADPFPEGVVPEVALSLEGNPDWIYVAIVTNSITNTGFTILLRNAYTATGIGAATVHYIAARP
jgi:hypothetical protein